jgi:hypothetical protein
MSENVHFSARQLRFIDWLASTKYERKPPTQELLAAEMGINPRTLTRWKSMPELSEAVTQRARDLLGDDLPEIYGALRREAIGGSFQHIKLAMELAGEYVERREHGGELIVRVVYDDVDNTPDETP